MSATDKGLGRSTTFPFATKRSDGPAGPLAYFDEGRGEAIVFVHGLVGDFTHFEHVAPAFAASHRIAGVDLPGCGISCKPDTRHSVAGHSIALLDWMTRIGIERATLVGHSAGGLVCTEAALLEPTRVARLVLLDSAGLRRYPAPLRWLGRALMRPWLLEATLEKLATPMLDGVFATKNVYTEKFRADSLDRPIYPTLREMAKVFHDLAPDLLAPTVLDNAWRLTMPVLVVWGDCDRLIPEEGIAEIMSLLPRGKKHVVDDCGHLPMIERPAAVIGALRDFLAPARGVEVAA